MLVDVEVRCVVSPLSFSTNPRISDHQYTSFLFKRGETVPSSKAGMFLSVPREDHEDNWTQSTLFSSKGSRSHSAYGMLESSDRLDEIGPEFLELNNRLAKLQDDLFCLDELQESRTLSESEITGKRKIEEEIQMNRKRMEEYKSMYSPSGGRRRGNQLFGRKKSPSNSRLQ